MWTSTTDYPAEVTEAATRLRFGEGNHALEKRMRSRGYLEAHNMALAFNMLRLDSGIALDRGKQAARQGAA